MVQWAHAIYLASLSCRVLIYGNSYNTLMRHTYLVLFCISLGSLVAFGAAMGR